MTPRVVDDLINGFNFRAALTASMFSGKSVDEILNGPNPDEMLSPEDKFKILWERMQEKKRLKQDG